MGRPVNADADATRGRILGSAAALFADVGIEGASVRDVARGAGVSLAMVHHYFGSKDDLYDACVDAMYAELGAMKGELGRQLASKAPVADVLSGAVAASFRFARAHRTAVRLLSRAAVSTGAVHPRGRALLLTMLEQVSAVAAAPLGRSPSDLRLPLQSLVFLIARYASQDEAELTAVAGFAPRERRRALEAVERHLVDLARELLGLDSARDRSARPPSPSARQGLR